VRKADNLPPSCAVVTKSGNLNFLEPSGPVQACNGTALPFTASLYLMPVNICLQSVSQSSRHIIIFRWHTYPNLWKELAAVSLSSASRRHNFINFCKHDQYILCDYSCCAEVLSFLMFPSLQYEIYKCTS